MTRLFAFAVTMLLFSTAYYTPGSSLFDNVTGTWKRTSMTLVDASGKATDMMQMMTKSMPCSKDITYTFTSDGQMRTIVPDACGSLKKTIESMNATGRWTSHGDKVTVTTTMKDIPPATYDLKIQGNTMTWIFNYSDNPKTPNPTKAKRMAITYQKL
ncbi:lipocalin family protein [Spirosoma sp. KNUC1025]|uniref:lipocalin family protein n=1 Tax=Spirosoma sp. KNUC1025 TaxID=2894082 RepID=UPI003864F12A|nr:lipocalin family protein [Spirosoma sp. KNUC1025]